MFDHDAMIESLVSSIEYVDFPSFAYRPPRSLRERHGDLEAALQGAGAPV